MNLWTSLQETYSSLHCTKFKVISVVLMVMKHHQVVQPWMSHSATQISLNSAQRIDCSFGGGIGCRKNKEKLVQPNNFTNQFHLFTCQACIRPCTDGLSIE